MELFFRPKYYRDFRNIRKQEVLMRLAAIFRQIEKAQKMEDIGELKKLDDYAHHYRIKIKITSKHDYRLVLMIRNNKVWAEHIALVTKIFYKQ